MKKSPLMMKKSHETTARRISRGRENCLLLSLDIMIKNLVPWWARVVESHNKMRCIFGECSDLFEPTKYFLPNASCHTMQ